jgi:hypothetical protein
MKLPKQAAPVQRLSTSATTSNQNGVEASACSGIGCVLEERSSLKAKN